ncbi:MAG: alpha/beta hydrolase [Anaerolineae bacterium]|nr:alpha/beta hydrolase [Anaerolineae bacterium]
MSSHPIASSKLDPVPGSELHTAVAEIPQSSSNKRRNFRWLRRIGVLVIGLILAGTIYESVSEASDIQSYPPLGQMVDVGGYRLHINCMGTGSPTVIIDAGLGAWSLEWSWVQAEVAKTTQVCTYDRAGMGYSESGSLPRTAEQFALELHTLLERANVVGPYVMAGHSLGGLPVRIFAHNYPTEVAGVVLIDSMSPGQMTKPAAEIQPQVPSQSSGVSLPFLLARIGLVRVLAGQLIPQTLPPEAQPAYTAFSVIPRSVQAWMDEGAGIQESLAQADAIKSFGDLPLIVLTGALHQMPEWGTMQAELLQLSSNSRQIIAQNSGHNIQIDQPEAAVTAIVDMVSQLR